MIVYWHCVYFNGRLLGYCRSKQLNDTIKIILKSLSTLVPTNSHNNSLIVDTPAHRQQTVLLLKRLSLRSRPKTGTAPFPRLFLLNHDSVQDLSFTHGQVYPSESGPAVALTLAE
jgi:hypothetical protein